MPIRVGILGAVSSYSLHYSETIRDMEGVELAGLVHFDRDPKYIRDSLSLHWLAKFPKTIEEMAERFRTELYEEADELYEKGKPDAVCLCMEDYHRPHYAEWGIERGLHVFMPKPFARSIDEALSAFDTSNEKGLITVGSLPTRFRSPSVTASGVIDEGRIGRPIMGHFSITHHLTLGGWKSDFEMAAGPELETGFYVFDQMLMLMKDEPRDIVGFGENHDHRGIPCIDNGKCVVRCKNGALSTIDLIMSTHHGFPRGRASHVIGDEGALVVDQDDQGAFVEIHTSDGVERIDCESWDPFERELGTWIGLIRDGGDPSEWQEEGLRTLNLILAYKEAHESGNRLVLADDDEEEEDE